MDNRVAGVCGAFCAGLLGLILLVACKGSDGDGQPTEVSPGSVVTSDGGQPPDEVTSISIESVTQPPHTSRTQTTDDCTIPGACLTTTNTTTTTESSPGQ